MRAGVCGSLFHKGICHRGCKRKKEGKLGKMSSEFLAWRRGRVKQSGYSWGGRREGGRRGDGGADAQEGGRSVRPPVCLSGRSIFGTNELSFDAVLISGGRDEESGTDRPSASGPKMK